MLMFLCLQKVFSCDAVAGVEVPQGRRGRPGSLFFAVAVAISAKANSCSLSPSLYANQCCVVACACVSFIFR